METKLEQTLKSKQPGQLKTFAQAGMKDPMPAPLVIHGTTNNASITKQADFGPGMMGNSTTQPTYFYSPELTPDAWVLPKSRIETLRFCKIYYNLDPYIHSILNMHAQYGFSKFKLQCQDPKYSKLYNSLFFNNPEFDWYQFALDVALSYYKYGEACLTGDTKIKLLDGTTKTLKELYDSKAKDFWVYSLDSEGNFVPGKADTVVLTRKNSEVLKVTLDNGESFKCTPDHLCMLRDGSYVEAQTLKAGDALMPLYTKYNKIAGKKARTKTKYEYIYNPATQKYMLTHVGVTLAMHKDQLRSVTGDRAIHHCNFNSFDNTPENLKVLSRSDHAAIHQRFKLARDPEWFKKFTKMGLEAQDRVKHAEIMREYWSDPEYRANIRKKHLERYANMSVEERERINKAIGATKARKYDKKRFRIAALIQKSVDQLSIGLPYRPSYNDIAKHVNKANNLTLNQTTVYNYVNKYGIVTLPSLPQKPTFLVNKIKVEKVQQELINHPDYSLAKISKLTGVSSATISSYIKLGYVSRYQNHKVVSIERVSNEDVFDIHSVDGYHNFGLACGVFVHNCVWGAWNAARRTWDRLVLIDPALIEYKEDLFTGHATIELIPTVEMKQAVKEAIMQGRQDIDPMLLDAVQNNKKLPLDTEGTEENVFTGQKYSPAKVFVFSRRCDPSSTRGTSILQSLFKALYLQDILRLSQIAVAQKTQLPIELWTVGHLGSDEQSSILPGPEMLEEVRAMITNATQQPPYSIVYGPYLKYEALGVTGKLLDIYNDLGYIENQILVGLGVNKAVVLGEGPNVQGKAISLNRLIREYAVLRDLFESFMQKYVLLPIAKANNLVDEEGQYILPKLVWDCSLSPEQDKERFDMCYKMWKDGLISTMSLFEKCPEKFDYILEMKRLEEERGSVFDKGNSQRLGNKPGTTGGTSVAPAGRTSGGNVRDGKGNPDLRDFALGGNNASAINDSSATGDTSVGDGASTPTGGI